MRESKPTKMKTPESLEVRTLHLGVACEVEEARLLVRIAQVPVGDGIERHEKEAESLNSDTAAIDGERR